jgi:hypothetical protein
VCNFLFIAADRTLPALDWNEDAPAVHLRKPEESPAVVREWLSKAFIYEIGSHDGCGCPFSLPYEVLDLDDTDLSREWNEGREAFRQLAKYLDQAISIAGTVELYNGFDYWLPPLERRSIKVGELTGEQFIFEERQLLIVNL